MHLHMHTLLPPPGIPRKLLVALTSSVVAIEASAEDQNSRNSFIDDTLTDTKSNQKSRPERPKKVQHGAPLRATPLLPVLRHGRMQAPTVYALGACAYLYICHPSCTAIGTPSDLLEELVASLHALEADAADQNSRQTFIEETLDDAQYNQKSRPKRPKRAQHGAPANCFLCLPAYLLPTRVCAGCMFTPV